MPGGGGERGSGGGGEAGSEKRNSVVSGVRGGGVAMSYGYSDAQEAFARQSVVSGAPLSHMGFAGAQRPPGVSADSLFWEK